MIPLLSCRLRRVFLAAVTCAAVLLSSNAADAQAPLFERSGAKIISGNARFTVYSPTLIRLEWSAAKQFCDTPSVEMAILKPGSPETPFTAETREGMLVVKTGSLTLRYNPRGGRFNPGNLAIEYPGGQGAQTWRPGDKDNTNLGGTRSLDSLYDFHGTDMIFKDKHLNTAKQFWRIPLPDGLLSRSGWHVSDETRTPRLTEDGWVAPAPDGDRIDWYFFGYGHDYAHALHDYASVAGRVPMPPRFALGAWCSKYFAYSDAGFREIVNQFRNKQIPLDVMAVDVDWHTNGWAGWDFNPALFPDPIGFAKWMHEHGIRLSPNDHPSGQFKAEDSNYAAVAQDIGWDTGEKKPIEFTLSCRDHADAYFKRLIEPHAKIFDCWWVDGCAKCGQPALNAALWTNYLYYTRTRSTPETRGWILSRYGDFGSHRYPGQFSGDTYSRWQVLDYETFFTPTASNVLAGYWSHDIGGFLGQQIDPELYVRWVQFGAFSPILRIHSDHGARLPWEFPPDNERIAADFFRLRYALLPYIYTADREFYDTGVALLRPMYYDYPEEADAYRCAGQYLFGPSLLVAPVTVAADATSGLAPKVVWLPPGQWTDIFTGENFSGPRQMLYATPLDRMPVFARAGAIVPQDPPKQNTAETSSRIILEVFPGAEGKARLYDDAGEGMAYQKGTCSWTNFHYTESASELNLTVGAATGTFPGQSSQRQVELRIRNCEAVNSVKVNGIEIPPAAQEQDKARKLLRIQLPISSIHQELDVRIAGRIAAPDAHGIPGAPGQ